GVGAPRGFGPGRRWGASSTRGASGGGEPAVWRAAMRVKAITPMHVGAEEIERRQRRYDRLAPAGMTITLFDLPASDGTPVALETADDIRASESLVIEAALATDPAQFDAILPDCVLDPGVPELDRRSPLPVLGIT